jgi:hypothetical protein
MDSMKVEIDNESPYNDHVQGSENVGAVSNDSFIKGGATTIGEQENEVDNLLKNSESEKNV